MAGRERPDLFHRHRIVPPDDGNAPQLTHVSREVVDEGVVVVDEKNHELMTFYHTFPVRRAWAAGGGGRNERSRGLLYGHGFAGRFGFE